MNAKEARELTDKNERPYEGIIKQIQCAAERGDSFFIHPKLSSRNIFELIKNGYKVSEGKDPFGVSTMTIIEW